MMSQIGRITVLCGIFIGYIFNAFAGTTAEQIYRFARRNDIRGLSNNAKDLNVLNKNGDTALCSAIKDGNVNAYNVLKNIGADTKPACIKSIDSTKYNMFMAKVDNPSKKTFLGLGKWAWGVIGAGAVTGGVAVAMGCGSGSGGSASSSNNGGSDIGNINTTCQERGYVYKYSDSCPDGWIKNSGDYCNNNDGGGVWFKCNIPYTCPADYSMKCADGYEEVSGDICLSGEKVYKHCVKTTCPYATISCSGGYTETGNTCRSGNTIYKECQPVLCSKYGSWSEQGCVCSEGWTGTLCNIPATCPYITTSCPYGHVATGETCQSGDTVYLECRFDSDNYIEQNGNTYEKLNCVHGNQIADSCSCEDGWSGTLCDKPVSCPYNTTSCTSLGSAYQETGNTCKSGNTLYKECEPIDCGAHAAWSLGTCVCDAGYGNWKKGAGCFDTSDCGNYAYKNWNGCACEPGYENWTYSDSYIGCHPVSAQYTKRINNTVNNGDVVGLENPAYNTIYTGINITNSTDSNVMGILENEVEGIVEHSIEYGGNIYITNNGNGEVYGIKHINAKGGDTSLSSVNYRNNHYSETSITINNIGDGFVYGIYRENKDGYNTDYSSATNLKVAADDNNTNNFYNQSMINLNNVGNGNIYGMYGPRLTNVGADIYIGSSNFTDYFRNMIGKIYVTNEGYGDAYGMYLTRDDNSKFYNIAVNAKYGQGKIRVINKSSGNAYGMFGPRLYNAKPSFSQIQVNAEISLINHASGNVYGMAGDYLDNTGNAKIDIINEGTGNAYGLYGNQTITNSGTVNIDNLGDGMVIGIYAAGATVKNSGTITIESTPLTDSNTSYTAGGTAIGIYAASGANVNNSGTITINGADTAYGIYAENGAKVTNTGTISIDGDSNHANAIVLNGSTLLQNGTMSASAFDFDSMNGNVVATNGAQFIAENDISGTLNLSSDIVVDGFNTTYVAENMIQAGDTSKLNLRSGSVMFDAKLAENGNDVFMTMKSFDTLTDNKSLAAYLTDNYTKGTSAEFFGGLKSGANMTEFNNILNGLSGMNAFTQFDREDMSAMREINFSMNQQMFMNNDRDEYQVGGSMEHFSFSNSSNGASGSYGISNSRISDNWKLGYGLAMANIGTNDDLGTSRNNQISLFYMPMTYTNDNIEFISTPRVGFAKSHYSRRGYNNMNYDGYIEKQIFGFNNDLRYPVTFGNWTIAPDLGFNAIMYRQSGNEGDQAFSLIIPADELYSAETGFGLFTKYERVLSSGGSLRFNSGVMLYRELADTCNMKLGIRGLKGTFNLYDDAEHNYSGAATFGFDYKSGRFSLYSNAQYFVDSDHYINLKGGISYRF